MTLFSKLASLSQRLFYACFFYFCIFISLSATAANKTNDLTFSQAELDQILAPIALYPDTVLSQLLIASTYPIEVVQADRWARTNTTAKGADAVKLVEKKDWDPSIKALVAFPDILQRMSDDIDWTQKLGDAFLADESRVMDTIQSLRKKAYASGSLNKVEHLKVQRTEDVIVIEPAEERVVYVPVYDTRVVYGNWWWPDYPPTYWHYPSHYRHVTGFYWGPSIYVGPTFFYSSCHWRNRHVVVIDRGHNHYQRPSFYTGRSIVDYEGSVAWRHAPIHRRGVAYYNDRLREDYGSRRESHINARAYREARTEYHTPTHSQRRFDDANPGSARGHTDYKKGVETNAVNPNNNLPVDRAEQLRERMGRPDNGGNNVQRVEPTNESGSAILLRQDTGVSGGSRLSRQDEAIYNEGQNRFRHDRQLGAPDVSVERGHDPDQNRHLGAQDAFERQSSGSGQAINPLLQQERNRSEEDASQRFRADMSRDRSLQQGFPQPQVNQVDRSNNPVPSIERAPPQDIGRQYNTPREILERQQEPSGAGANRPMRVDDSPLPRRESQPVAPRVESNDRSDTNSTERDFRQRERSDRGM